VRNSNTTTNTTTTTTTTTTNNNNNNNNVKAKVIPVTIAVTGTISKPLRQYLRNVPAKQGIKKLQRTAVLGAAHTYIAEGADVELQNIFHVPNNITCSTNCKYRTAATL
jgi:hypothetical protein